MGLNQADWLFPFKHKLSIIIIFGMTTPCNTVNTHLTRFRNGAGVALDTRVADRLHPGIARLALAAVGVRNLALATQSALNGATARSLSHAA